MQAILAIQVLVVESTSLLSMWMMCVGCCMYYNDFQIRKDMVLGEAVVVTTEVRTINHLTPYSIARNSSAEGACG